MNLQSFVPTIEHGLSLTVEELAWPTLRALIALGKGQVHASNLTAILLSPYNESPHANSRPGGPKGLDDLARALQEAVSWLTSHGLLAQFVESNYAYYFVTRRGRDIGDEEQFRDLLKEIAFNPASLHPDIRGDAWHIYSRGQFDVAVFTAFKRVEVAVREAGALPAEKVGTDLMRAAFDSKDGPLTDVTLPKAEREAIAHLFAGSIGAFKNPNSHREVELDDPAKVAELLMLASHLMRIVEERRSALGSAS